MDTPAAAAAGKSAVRARAGILCLQLAFCRIAPLEIKAIGAAFESQGHKIAGERLAPVVDLRLQPTAVVHALLEVCPSPRPSACTGVAVPVRVPEVDGFHGAAAIIVIIRLGFP